MREPITACIFDAYGTLFDLHSAVARHSGSIGENAAALSNLWRNKQLEYSWIRSGMAGPADGWRDFWSLTEEALDFAMQYFKLRDEGLRRRLLDAYLSLDAFPEVPPVLSALKSIGMRTAILSNGSLRMLQSALDSSGLAESIDVVCSADEVSIFKPSPRLYGLAARKLGIAPRGAIFVSSNAWDAASAAAFGFKVMWINRAGQKREYAFAPLIAEKPDLTSMPDFVRMRGAA